MLPCCALRVINNPFASTTVISAIEASSFPHFRKLFAVLVVRLLWLKRRHVRLRRKNARTRRKLGQVAALDLSNMVHNRECVGVNILRNIGDTGLLGETHNIVNSLFGHGVCLFWIRNVRLRPLFSVFVFENYVKSVGC